MWPALISWCWNMESINILHGNKSSGLLNESFWTNMCWCIFIDTEDFVFHWGTMYSACMNLSNWCIVIIQQNLYLSHFFKFLACTLRWIKYILHKLQFFLRFLRGNFAHININTFLTIIEERKKLKEKIFHINRTLFRF